MTASSTKTATLDCARVDDTTYRVGDMVLVRCHGFDETLVARIDGLRQDKQKHIVFDGCWYYAAHQTKGGRLAGHDPREVFETAHAATARIETIDGHCTVLPWGEYQEWLDNDESDDEGDERPVFVCRAFYHVESGEFGPLTGASSMADAVRHHQRPAKRKRNNFAEAAARLAPTMVPEYMPCRDSELAMVTNTLRATLLEGQAGGSLYLSGTPGTGKTATLHQALRKLAGEVQVGRVDDDDDSNDAVPPFRTVFLNAMKLAAPDDAYSLLWAALTDERLSNKLAIKRLEVRFGKRENADAFEAARPASKKIVLVLDELDTLVNRKQSILYNVFEVRAD